MPLIDQSTVKVPVVETTTGAGSGVTVAVQAAAVEASGPAGGGALYGLAGARR